MFELCSVELEWALHEGDELVSSCSREPTADSSAAEEW